HGVFGAAAAASRLMRLPERETLMALSLAGSHASGTTEYTIGGGDIKRFHAGMGAAGGIRSARAAACGMTGPATILEGKRGILQAFSDHPDPKALVDGLGTQWALMQTEVKPYTVCGLLNGQIDALRSIMKEHSIQVDDIAKIIVGGDRFAMTHVGSIGPRPKTIIEAQFSTHFSLAMSAVLGANDFSAYHAMAKENFEHAGVCELARRIEMVLDPDLEARYPDISKATVTAVTKGGRKLYGEGFCFRELPQEEVESKFRKLVDGTLTPEQARGIMETIANMETIEKVTGLTGLLVRGK
ncbi:MAG: MmgE/PrpD family protein, partial [Betaproteobacteria bacterium]|nr:MmgE/PrpD family protein [Betaproteobacteria bacterium]